MTICLTGISSGFELERLAAIFLPEDKIAFRAPDGEKDEVDCVICVNADDKEVSAGIDYYGRRLEYCADISGSEKSLELEAANALYTLLCGVSGYTPPWGMLTGVRPVKLLRMVRDESGIEEARRVFREEYRCSEEKLALCEETEKNERPLLELSRPESFSLYIGIPFCPSRCSYCSFVSQSVEMAAKLIPSYVEALCREIEETALIARSLGLRLETVYMGGGTPTVLTAAQLEKILTAVNEKFDLSCLREYTVEAGRPDTVTAEKLEAIKRCGAGRISINPQTMSDRVLEAIGRRHTAADVAAAMETARRAGFDCINMDMIAGLPGDTLEGFRDSLDKVLAFSPENVTVHTLAMKRASFLTKEGKMPSSEKVGDMLSHVSGRLHEAGFIPYYLYRQTRMLGNLENVGWSLPGMEGLYNIYIMDETHTVIGLGGGGVTKLKAPRGGHIERIYNYKFPYEYIERFNVISERKKGIVEFYEKFG